MIAASATRWVRGLALLLPAAAMAQAVPGAACTDPDFAPIFDRLTRIGTVSGAMEYRFEVLPSICGLRGLDRLTDLEAPSDPQSLLVPGYADAISAFVVAHFGELVAGRAWRDLSPETVESLLGKTRGDRDYLAVRKALIPTSRSCDDFRWVTSGDWGQLTSWPQRRVLENWRWRYWGLYCGR